MKEEEFLEKVNNRINSDEGFIVKLYYSVDDGGNVILDEEGMTEEFKKRLGWMREILEQK